MPVFQPKTFDVFMSMYAKSQVVFDISIHSKWAQTIEM